jgi:Lamin Tail Domain
VEVTFGGQAATVLYKGRSGCCSGVDQIRFRVPAGISGCYIPVSLTVEGVVSNTTTMSIATSGSRCSDPVHLNEGESNGGTPGDWVELINPSASPVDISGMRFLDNDNTHTLYVIPAGTMIAPGGYYLLEEAAFGFGLGAPDSARLFDSTGALYETYNWTAHATPTYGRCANGTGAFTTTTSSTKGAANDCSPPPVTTLHINDIESNGGTPGDWVELINTGTASIDISGFRFLDNDDAHTPYVIPAGTTVAAGGYYLIEEAAFGFGLGAPGLSSSVQCDGRPV